MATSLPVRHIGNLLIALLIVGTFTTACKKSGGSDSDVDPRDQYIGSYDGGYQASTLVNNSLESNRESGKVAITVSKSQAPNQIYLELVFNGITKQNLTAELSGTEFTVIDKQSESLLFDGKTYEATYSAKGQLVQATITVNTTTETLQSGITLTRQGSIVATKK